MARGNMRFYVELIFANGDKEHYYVSAADQKDALIEAESQSWRVSEDADQPTDSYVESEFPCGFYLP